MLFINISSLEKSKKPCTEIHEDGIRKKSANYTFLTLLNGGLASGRTTIKELL